MLVKCAHHHLCDLVHRVLHRVGSRVHIVGKLRHSLAEVVTPDCGTVGACRSDDETARVTRVMKLANKRHQQQNVRAFPHASDV